MKSSCTAAKFCHGGLLVASLVLILISSAQAQIFVTNPSSGTVSEYNLDGTPANTALITGLTSPENIVISGTDLFVSSNSEIGEYTTSGATVNASLLSAQSFAVSGPDLFTLSGTTVAEYTTSGTLVNSSLITGLSGPPTAGLAVSGSFLFINNTLGHVAEYTISGTLVNNSLVNGGVDSTIAASGSNLFVAASGGSIKEYDDSGTLVNDSGVSAQAFTVSGSDLFVAYGTGTVHNLTTSIGEYTVSGTIVNASLISGLPYDSIGGIAVESAPEPSTWAFLLCGLGLLVLGGMRKRRMLNHKRELNF